MSNILHQLPPSVRGMLYVDDLQVSCQGSDMRLIERQLQITVNRLVQWCDQNGHTISPPKSSCVHFCRKRNLHPDPSIHIGHIQIPVVSAVRFLGVIFDCKLTFLPHVLYLRKRCGRSLNILKNADTPTVIEILLLRKLERKGFDIIFSWVPGHVGILGNERADTAARSMSDHMQRPVCYQDLKTSAKNYIHRVWQEAWDQQVLKKLHSIHPSTSHWAALPVRRHDVHLTRLHIGHTRFTRRHLLLGENAPECPSCKDKSLPVQIIRSLFDETVNRNFQDFYIIATDASKNEQITSIAGITANSYFAYRINHNNSIFTVEALAICQALDDLSIINKNLLILSDNLSALQNYSIKSHSVIHKLASKIYILSLYNNQLILLWTPGHSNILWNEQADNLARTVTESNVYIDWISSEDINKKIYQESFKKANDNFYSSKYFVNLGNIPNISTISKWTRNRREEILCTRIFSKMIITPGLLHKFNLSDNANCRSCNCLNDLDHILLNCNRYIHLSLSKSSKTFSQNRSTSQPDFQRIIGESYV
ncbi:putative RNA-directed DNA polymerase from transposon BS [Trichonephila clavipes]|nr:putative RNA-directed DNA polymerase from transposon BS [Trichonephila clavipes]